MSGAAKRARAGKREHSTDGTQRSTTQQQQQDTEGPVGRLLSYSNGPHRGCLLICTKGESTSAPARFRMRGSVESLMCGMSARVHEKREVRAIETQAAGRPAGSGRSLRAARSDAGLPRAALVFQWQFSLHFVWEWTCGRYQPKRGQPCTCDCGAMGCQHGFRR